MSSIAGTGLLTSMQRSAVDSSTDHVVPDSKSMRVASACGKMVMLPLSRNHAKFA